MDPIILTESGKIRGKECKNVLTGKPFYSFHGVPYAKPPLRDLRFKAPIPVEPWEGIRDTLDESDISITGGPMPGTTIGSEDCLYLNIHIPEMPCNNKTEKKAVMCYIHGGGFSFGSGSPSVYGADYLASEDVILVTMNYRLGFLGFMKLDDPTLGATGNAGLKDIICSLEWIQRNIAHFGGDPNCVTIFGGSAGAACTHYLHLMPASRGLFHRAIIQSGAATSYWGLKTIDWTMKLVRNLGCHSENDKAILDFLIRVPAEKIVIESNKLLSLEDKCSGELFPFGPAIENAKSKNAMVVEPPQKVLKNGNFAQVPIMFGTSSEEGIFHYGEVQKDGVDKLSKILCIPSTFKIPDNKLKAATEKIRNYYFNKLGLSKEDAYYKYYGDIEFVEPTIEAMMETLQKTTEPVYCYKFRIDARCNYVKIRENIKAKGAAHGDELGYIFRNSTHIIPEPGSKEHTTILRMTRLWTNFAKTGNPNLPNPLPGIDWKPMSKEQFHYIDIGEELRTGEVNPDQKELDFFQEIVNEFGSKK